MRDDFVLYIFSTKERKRQPFIGSSIYYVSHQQDNIFLGTFFSLFFLVVILYIDRHTLLYMCTCHLYIFSLSLFFSWLFQFKINCYSILWEFYFQTLSVYFHSSIRNTFFLKYTQHNIDFYMKINISILRVYLIKYKKKKKT